MDLIWTNTAHVPQGELVSPALDLQYGDEQNDFELTHSTPGLLLSDGCYIGAEDTEFGGRVDAVRITVDDGHALYTLTGRTWHGLLAGKILQPDSGADRLTVSGDANSIIRTVISRIGLSTVFDVPSEASGITLSNYSFRRYITAWDGLRMMLTAQGARLDLTYTAGRCRIRAVAADTYGDADSDQRISFEAQRIWTQVNHLTGLGKGQLRNRARSDWYADASGNISQTQTLTRPGDSSDLRAHILRRRRIVRPDQGQAQGHVETGHRRFDDPREPWPAYRRPCARLRCADRRQRGQPHRAHHRQTRQRHTNHPIRSRPIQLAR